MVEPRHLELVDELCRKVNSPDLYEYLKLPHDASADVLLEGVRKERRRLQGMQSNPKYKDAAIFYIKHIRALEAIASEPDSYAKHLIRRQEAEGFRALEVAIDGILADGRVTPNEMRYFRDVASNLGIAIDAAERLLADRCAKIGLEMPEVTAEITDTGRPVSESVATPREAVPGDASEKSAAGQGWDPGFVHAMLEQLPAGKGHVVDLYCRMGTSALVLLERRKDLSWTGIDRNEERAEMARRTLREFGPRAEIRIGEPTSLPVEDESADTVLSVRALQTQADSRLVLAEALRALRPGGRIVVVEPDGISETFYFNGHLVEFNTAFRALCLRVEAIIAERSVGDAKDGRAGIALGPLLPRRLDRAGFEVRTLSVHASATLKPVARSKIARRLRNYTESMARFANLAGSAPEVAVTLKAVNAFEIAGASDEMAMGGNVLPLFLCTGVKT